jgi:hypothetical protein
MPKFEVYDLTSERILEQIKGNKGEADRRFVELKKEYPKKKLWLRMTT